MKHQVSAYHCMENPVIPGRIKMEWFIPVEIYRKKVIPFKVLPFPPFYRNKGNFRVCIISLVNQCQASS